MRADDVAVEHLDVEAAALELGGDGAADRRLAGARALVSQTVKPLLSAAGTEGVVADRGRRQRAD